MNFRDNTDRFNMEPSESRRERPTIVGEAHNANRSTGGIEVVGNQDRYTRRSNWKRPNRQACSDSPSSRTRLVGGNCEIDASILRRQYGTMAGLMGECAPGLGELPSRAPGGWQARPVVQKSKKTARAEKNYAELSYGQERVCACHWIMMSGRESLEPSVYGSCLGCREAELLEACSEPSPLTGAHGQVQRRMCPMTSLGARDEDDDSNANKDNINYYNDNNNLIKPDSLVNAASAGRLSPGLTDAGARNRGPGLCWRGKSEWFCGGDKMSSAMGVVAASDGRTSNGVSDHQVECFSARLRPRLIKPPQADESGLSGPPEAAQGARPTGGGRRPAAVTAAGSIGSRDGTVAATSTTSIASSSSASSLLFSLKRSRKFPLGEVSRHVDRNLVEDSYEAALCCRHGRRACYIGDRPTGSTSGENNDKLSRATPARGATVVAATAAAKAVGVDLSSQGLSTSITAGPSEGANNSSIGGTDQLVGGTAGNDDDNQLIKTNLDDYDSGQINNQPSNGNTRAATCATAAAAAAAVLSAQVNKSVALCCARISESANEDVSLHSALEGNHQESGTLTITESSGSDASHHTRESLAGEARARESARSGHRAEQSSSRGEHLAWRELVERHGRMTRTKSAFSGDGQLGGRNSSSKHARGSSNEDNRNGSNNNNNNNNNDDDDDDHDHHDHEEPNLEHFASVRRRSRASRSSCLLHLLSALIQTIFPFFGSFKGYSLPGDLFADLAAGFTVAVLHIPQGMAYGLLSGVEPINGLYVSFIPVLVMTVMGKSRHVSYGTFAMISMLLMNTIENTRTSMMSRAGGDFLMNATSSQLVSAKVAVPLVVTDNHGGGGQIGRQAASESGEQQRSRVLLVRNLLSQTVGMDNEQAPQSEADDGPLDGDSLQGRAAEATELLIEPVPATRADAAQEVAPPLVTQWNGANLPSNIEILTCVCIVCGFIHITMSLMRLGILSLMFSDQLVSSFTTACGIHVLTSQLASLFDLKLPHINDELFKVGRIWWQFGHAILFEGFNHTTAWLTLSSIGFLLFIKQLVEPALRRRYKRPAISLPSECALMATVIFCSWYLKLNQDYQVKIVGHVPTGLPEAHVPRLELVPYVFEDALTIALISFAMNLSIAQVYAKKFHYKLNANQELFALGTANLVGSFFSCFPCASSLSRSSVQSSLNVRSQLCSLFSCAIVVLVICFFAHILHDLPRSTLSCIIVVALKGILMQIRDLFDNWRLSKLDALVWMLTFASVIIFGVTYGLVLGIIASLFMIFLRLLTPNHSIMGRLPNTDIYVDSNAFAECEEIERIKIFRFNSALCYLNRTMLKSKIEKLLPHVYKPQGFGAICAQFHEEQRTHQGHLEASNGQVKFLIVDCSALSYCDYAGAATLVELVCELESEKVAVYLAACPLKLISMFEKMSSANRMLESNLFPTISDAVGRARQLLAGSFELPSSRLDQKRAAPSGQLKSESILDVP